MNAKKPRIGRPPLPKKLAKGALLSVRFADDERRLLDRPRAARASGFRNGRARRYFLRRQNERRGWNLMRGLLRQAGNRGFSTGCALRYGHGTRSLEMLVITVC